MGRDEKRWGSSYLRKGKGGLPFASCGGQERALNLSIGGKELVFKGALVIFDDRFFFFSEARLKGVGVKTLLRDFKRKKCFLRLCKNFAAKSLGKPPNFFSPGGKTRLKRYLSEMTNERADQPGKKVHIIPTESLMAEWEGNLNLKKKAI